MPWCHGAVGNWRVLESHTRTTHHRIHPECVLSSCGNDVCVYTYIGKLCFTSHHKLYSIRDMFTRMIYVWTNKQIHVVELHLLRLDGFGLRQQPRRGVVKFAHECRPTSVTTISACITSPINHTTFLFGNNLWRQKYLNRIERSCCHKQ